MKRNRPLHNYEILSIIAFGLIVLISIVFSILIWILDAKFGTFNYVPLHDKIIVSSYFGMIAILFTIMIIQIWRKGL